jgi:hypothetical protein
MGRHGRRRGTFASMETRLKVWSSCGRHLGIGALNPTPNGLCSGRADNPETAGQSVTPLIRLSTSPRDNMRNARTLRVALSIFQWRGPLAPPHKAHPWCRPIVKGGPSFKPGCARTVRVTGVPGSQRSAVEPSQRPVSSRDIEPAHSQRARARYFKIRKQA